MSSLTALRAWQPVRPLEPTFGVDSSWAAPGTPRATLALVLLAHAGVLGALLLAPEPPALIVAPRPLMVSLIQPELVQPQPEPPQPEPPQLQPPRPTPPKPQTAVRTVVKQTPPVPAAKPVATPSPAPTVQQPAPEAMPPPSPDPAPEVMLPPSPLVAAAAPAPEPAPPAPPTPPRTVDYLTNPKPSYPALSRRLGEEGIVRLKVLVNPDGSVAQLELAKSSGFTRLDQSALNTVLSSWKFLPGTQDGKPVAAWVVVPIEFTLRS